MINDVIYVEIKVDLIVFCTKNICFFDESKQEGKITSFDANFSSKFQIKCAKYVRIKNEG